VVLAGGLGTRLGEISQHTPKPMVSVSGKPLLEHVLLQLRSNGIDSVTLSVGHLADKIQRHFGPMWQSVKLSYQIEAKPLGTGGALLQSLENNASSILVLNGDTYQKFELSKLSGRLGQGDCEAVILVREVEDSSDFGSVTLDRDGNVLSWHEKTISGAKYVYSGIAFFDARALKAVSNLQKIDLGPVSLELDLMPTFLRKFRVAAVVSSQPFFDIGTPDRLHQAQMLVGDYLD